MVGISVLYPAGDGKKFDVDIPNRTNIPPQIQLGEIVAG